MATRIRGPRPNPFGTSGLADMSTPQMRRLAATNVANLYDRVPEKQKAEGRVWYDKVHEATAKGVRRRGLDVVQGAGIVAAVSPNMDWEKNNIDAFKELGSLKSEHWDAIHAAAGGNEKAKAQVRNDLKGMGISTAPAANLVKAHRIMQGEPVSEVLPRRTAPKTDSFASNIAFPDRAGHVTIDGRAHDIAVDSMRGWKEGRGIGSAALPSGKTSRYEHFENAYRAAATAVGELPHNMQAITWVGGKSLERSGTTASGQPRKVGMQRRGQGYSSL